MLEKLRVKDSETESRGWFNKSRAQRMLKVGHAIADNIKKTLENEYLHYKVGGSPTMEIERSRYKPCSKQGSYYA